MSTFHIPGGFPLFEVGDTGLSYTPGAVFLAGTDGPSEKMPLKMLWADKNDMKEKESISAMKHS